MAPAWMIWVFVRFDLIRLYLPEGALTWLRNTSDVSGRTLRKACPRAVSTGFSSGGFNNVSTLGSYPVSTQSRCAWVWASLQAVARSATANRTTVRQRRR